MCPNWSVYHAEAILYLPATARYAHLLNLPEGIPQGFRGCLGRRMAFIRPNPTKVDVLFLLYYYFTSDWRTVIANKTLSGATVDRITNPSKASNAPSTTRRIGWARGIFPAFPRDAPTFHRRTVASIALIASIKIPRTSTNRGFHARQM